MKNEILIESEVPIPKVIGRGRKKGDGRNLSVLARMKPGDSISGLTRKRMGSYRTSACREGISIRIRMIEEDSYAIWRLE